MKTKTGSSEALGINESNQKVNNLFLKHVKLKKRHEINLMADIVDEAAKKTKCNAIIDFGSGLGHLVRMLAYKKGMFAAGIECQRQLTEDARSVLLVCIIYYIHINKIITFFKLKFEPIKA